MSNRIQPIEIENAKIIWRNFAGKGDTYNREGNRNFNVVIEDESSALMLQDEGWNVRLKEPREGYDGDPFYHMEVTVSYANIPPNVWLITSSNKTLLDENTIESLDYAEIESIDLVISPYRWEVNGKTGVKAYLKTAYVTIVEDRFSSKYGL